MAPLALPYERSHIALKTLHRTIERAAASVDLILPEQPQNLSTEQDPYIYGAISMLSASTNYLYDDHSTWVTNTLETKDGIDTLNKRIGGVEKDVRLVKSQLNKFKSQAEQRYTKLESQVDEVKSQVVEVKSQVG